MRRTLGLAVHGEANWFVMETGGRYVIEDATTGDVLSRHHTRQATIDNWRHFADRPVKVFRVYRDQRATKKLVFEGTWRLDAAGHEGEDR